MQGGRLSGDGGYGEGGALGGRGRAPCKGAGLNGGTGVGGGWDDDRGED